MSLLQDGDITDNFKKPEEFANKLTVLKEQLPAILDDFEKYYVFYNKNPEYDEYQQMFNNITNNLTNINSSMFLLSNDVQSSIDDINKKLVEINLSITKEKCKNEKLQSNLGISQDKNNATTELISDYKKIYDSGYLQNWSLFLSILIAIFAIKKNYTN
jgi:hypothetical protein